MTAFEDFVGEQVLGGVRSLFSIRHRTHRRWSTSMPGAKRMAADFPQKMS
ncbi:hypothetical protein AWB69_08033 [Caballeronia udeis]|uniref:Uncharacterized protein n=1 Tax=Caballeronia udeis TaxID=1232866 RepID=A0A158JI73_9BURK|nr:hypothetical protein AWB69_08033 [Caballeronia udeis]